MVVQVVDFRDLDSSAELPRARRRLQEHGYACVRVVSFLLDEDPTDDLGDLDGAGATADLHRVDGDVNEKCGERHRLSSL